MLSTTVLRSGLLFLSCGTGLSIASCLYKEQIGCTASSGIAGGLCLLTGLILLDAYRLKPSNSHTWRTLFIQYFVLRFVKLHSAMMRRRLRKICQNCQKQQQDILLHILKTNKDTLFAKDNHLTNIKTVDDYQKQVPLTRYSDYKKYVDLVVDNGLADVMFPGTAGYIAVTSGTTGGKSKMYPKSLDIRKSRLIPWLIFLAYHMQSVPGSYFLSKVYSLQSKPKTTFSNSGIEQGPVVSYMTGKDIGLNLLPPYPIYQEDLLMYVCLAVGLLKDDIINISSITSSTLLAFFKTLEQKWENLCDDIERGQLSEELDIPQDLRQELNKYMYKDPVRADILRSEFKRGFVNIVRRIWPRCCCLFGIRTGAFQTQTRLLREKYIGDLPIITGLHTGTESIYGINLSLLDEYVRYTLLADINFFEFIPEAEMDEDTPTTWMAHQLEVGKSYEMVVTTWDGLYRYRTEDVIQVTGFLDTLPQYKFVRRAGDILSSNSEKVPEVLVYDSVLAAANTWINKTVVEFTSVENIRVESITGAVSGTCFYYIFIEMGTEDPISDKEGSLIDIELKTRHEVYEAMRKSEKLKSVRVVQVKSGTFDRVKAAMLQANNQASFAQYKLPRIMRREDMLELLLEQRLAKT